MRSLLFLLLAGTVFTACNKDDDDPVVKANTLKYGTTEATLTKGYIENYGEDAPGIYQLDLSLYSSGVTIHLLGGGVDSLSGTGAGLYFELFTSKEDQLDTRTYTLDTLNLGANGTFDLAMVAMNYNFSTYTGTGSFLTSGTLAVKKDGSTYEFTFSGTDFMGVNVTGYYKGSVAYYDYSKKSIISQSDRKMWMRK